VIRSDLPAWLLEHDEMLRLDGWSLVTIVRVWDCGTQWCRSGVLSFALDLFGEK